jgi:hypothetical protein
MPDYPKAALDAATEAIHRRDCDDPDCLADSRARDFACAALDAAAQLLANAVAGRIIAFADEHAPKGDHVPSARRRALMTAAQVASRAFTTRDEELRAAALAIARGDFACCGTEPPEIT